MRVVFLGTPSFGIPALNMLYEKHELLACVCQPDKLGARGKTEFSAVKRFALSHNVSLFQFEKISREGVDVLKKLAPDIMVTAAYGQILSQEIIDIAPHGIINIHGSLLPALRGAAPIQYAVLQGLQITGVSILKTVKRVDAGDVVLQKAIDILPDETNGELFERMSVLGAQALDEALEQIADGTAVYTPQDEDRATFCSKITADMEKIDWNKPRREVINLVRALCPSPCAWTTLDGKRLRIYKLSICDQTFSGVPGQIVLRTKKQLAVMCADGAVFVDEIQKENARRMDIAAFLCGSNVSVGAVLGADK